MTRSSLSVLTVAALLLALQVSPVSAGFIAVESTQTTGNTSFGDTQYAGWRFTLSDSVTINAIGIWDSDQDGLLLSHDIGIFETGTGNNIALDTIASGTSDLLLGGTRWIELPEITLVAGVSYDIVATSMCESTVG